MRCVVAGAGGFIGSAIVRQLLADGHTVAQARRPSSSTARVDGLDLHSIMIDERFEPDTVGRSLKEFGTDVVINLAWQGVANYARNDEEQYDNIALSDRWARASVIAGVGHHVGVGSQAEYGPTEGIVDESRPLNPTTRYGVAKAAAGLATQAALNDTDTAFSWVRIFSAYGPGDAPHWMIQSIGRRLIDEDPAELTPGTQLWDFIYVDDVARAFAAIAGVPQGVGFVNLGSGTADTVRHIVERMKRISGSSSELAFGAVPFRPDQVMHLQADIGELRRRTGWSPTVTLEDGLTQTMDYLKRNR